MNPPKLPVPRSTSGKASRASIVGIASITRRSGSASDKLALQRGGAVEHSIRFNEHGSLLVLVARLADLDLVTHAVARVASRS